MKEIITPEKEQVEKELTPHEIKALLKFVKKFNEMDEETKGSHLPYVKETVFSKKQQRIVDSIERQMNPDYDYKKGMIMAMAVVLTKEEKLAKAKAEEEKKHVKLTVKQVATITKETIAKRKLLLTIPLPPYTVIIPAMELSKMNPAQLCTYFADKYTRILAVPEFVTASPDISISQDIYLLLSPLTGNKRLTLEQRTNLITYTKQLRDNFTLTVGSIVTICNGNLPLFFLTGIKTKRAPVKYNSKLPATAFTLSTNKGRGSVGVSCKKIPYADKYIVFYGKGTYDPLTWQWKIGTTRIVIEGLNPKDDISFIMVAIGKLGLGFFADAQTRTVPSN